MSKSIKVSDSYAVKETVGFSQECHDCCHRIKGGEQYYRLSFKHYQYGYFSKCICEGCWQARGLQALEKRKNRITSCQWYSLNQGGWSGLHDYSRFG